MGAVIASARPVLAQAPASESRTTEDAPPRDTTRPLDLRPFAIATGIGGAGLLAFAAFGGATLYNQRVYDVQATAYLDGTGDPTITLDRASTAAALTRQFAMIADISLAIGIAGGAVAGVLAPFTRFSPSAANRRWSVAPWMSGGAGLTLGGEL